MSTMNVFRVLGDISHTTSKCILIWAIHSNKSAEGVSLITQALYAVVFGSRYVDLLWTDPIANLWNFVLKNFYIFSSLYIIFVMMRLYARTREREKAWRFGSICFGGALVAAPLVTLIFRKWAGTTILEVLWTFSIILESVCVLPQLILLRQTDVPTVIDSFYLLTLGSYRAFYILNWITRAIVEKRSDPIPDIFGVVQTAFYVDFAWVYWTRQRVKLRNGGVIDSEDLSRGWLLSRLLGGHAEAPDAEEAAGTQGGTTPNPRTSGRGKWGVRGVSVSADDEETNPWPQQKTGVVTRDSNPELDELDDILDDDRDDHIDNKPSSVV